MQKMIALGCVVAAVLTVMSSEVFAISVCYRVGQDDNHIFRVDVAQHSTLTTTTERDKFGPGHPIQRVYTVNGKSLIDGEEGYIKGTVNGTIILGQGIGAQMGLTYLAHHDFAGFQGSLLDCESSVVSSMPDEWSCRSVSFFPSDDPQPIEEHLFRLTRIDPLNNELCSRFTLSDTEPWLE